MKKLILLIFCLCTIMQGFAKNQNSKDTYNMRRAQEEYGLGNVSSALEYINQEIAENPKNGYAYLSLANCEFENGAYAKSLEATDKALKYLSKKDKELHASLYRFRSNLLQELGDTVKGLEEINKAIATDSKNSESYQDRGELYYNLNRMAESDADYRKVTELKPSEAIGYIGLGRNAKVQGDYPAAVSYFTKAISLEPNNSMAYAFRGNTYQLQEKYVQAADDIAKALAIDFDTKAYWLLFEFPEEQVPLIVAKLKVLAASSPYEPAWPYYMGLIYSSKRKYREAIPYYITASGLDSHPSIWERLAEAYRNTGNYRQAKEALEQAVLLDPSEVEYLGIKAEILEEEGDLEGAIAIWDDLIEKVPDSSFAFTSRGMLKRYSRGLDEALPDLDMALILNPEDGFVLLAEADIYKKKGNMEKAMEFYRKILEFDTVPSLGSRAMYAYHELGQDDKAVEYMDKIIEKDPGNPDIYFEAACLYTRMGRYGEALQFLDKYFEKGSYDMAQVMKDYDLEDLRKTEGFKKLYEKYEDRDQRVDRSARGVINEEAVKNEDGGANAADEEKYQVEIPFTPDSGCCQVKCTINGLPLSFIFDTGASVVSISQLEANFMLKNGFLDKNDIMGSGRFVDANGNISVGTLINLRDVEFGGVNLHNVKASVVQNQKAPLLLGQTVLNRLGKIEIDNSNKKLIITR